MTSTAGTKASAGNELFLKNMAALWRVDAELAVRIDEVPDEKRWAVERTRSGRTRSGEWTTAAITPAGHKAYVHSRYDPSAEAEKLADSVEMEGNYCFVVAGFGLGYHVRALYARLRGEAFMVVTEPSLELLTTALAYVDLAEEIASRRLIILWVCGSWFIPPPSAWRVSFTRPCERR
ncbi:MAG: hypothetical protein ACYSUI_00690 [Planctomycetota bacterium]|jgi:hypothetical protein